MMFFPWHRALRSKTLWFSGAGILLFGLVAGLAAWLAPHDPYRNHIYDINLPPMWVEGALNPGVAEYPLGTDRFGRDVLSRLLYGTRTAFFLALLAVPLAALLGTLAGFIAGYAGGRLDTGIMFVADMLQSLPGIMFAVLIILICRSQLTPSWLNGVFTLVIAFAAVSWVSLARLIRINILQLKAQPFVEAARALGASPGHIIFRHLLPNVSHVVLVWVINNIPAVILLEAALGYIGIGVTAAMDGDEFTVVSWGGMFYAGRSAMNRHPLMLVIPALSLLWLSMSFVLLGDFLNKVTRREQS